MKKSILLPLAFSLLAAGCSTFTAGDAAGTAALALDTAAAAAGIAAPYRSDTRAAAVVCGLTRVNPAAYNGWGGACPGCDVDAQTFAIACQSNGVGCELLLNEKATSVNIVEAAKRACANLRPGDLLILYLSSHGGQVNDLNGDEADGKDETLCLWDGQMTDDVVWGWLGKVPAGVRIWMVTDTCNSGTNYRGPRRIAPGIRARAALRSPPSDLHPSSFSLQPSLLHWGGCADGHSSYGSAQGGTFTTALVDAYKTGQAYEAWFTAAKSKMPPGQIPTCETTGLDFSNLPAFR